MNDSQGLSTLIIDYINTRAEEKLEKLDKEIAKLAQSANEADQAKLELQQQKRRDEQEKFIPVNWLTDAAKRAGQLQLVTHAPKFIHSDAKASGIFATADSQPNATGLVNTAVLNKPAIDVIGNAAALDVGKLLQLSDAGKALIDYVAQDDISPLLTIAQNSAQATQWLQGFKQAIDTATATTHKFAKQVYWPIGTVDEPQYRLLTPLYATSLQQDIYQTVNDTRFSDLAKVVKEDKSKQQYNDKSVVYFTDVAEQHFGGTKPQNISQLNSKRYGKGYLLSAAAPPKWQSVDKPPLNEHSIFDRIFNHRAGKHGYSLRRYLEDVFHHPSVKTIRDERAERIERIIDVLFGYIGEVHQLSPGWSASDDCQLPLAEQLLLDPKRRHVDDKFMDAWDAKEWPEQVAAAFSNWLNRQLAGVKNKSERLAPSNVEFVQWKVLVAQKLRILKDDFQAFYNERVIKEHS